MGDKTGIGWTDSTWNPIVGCSVVSPGCTNCYAMRDAGSRLAGTPKYEGLTAPSRAGPVWNGKVRFWEPALDQPLRWRRPRRIFPNSMSDLWHEAVETEWLDAIFAVMALAPQHTFQPLTKRADRMQAYMADPETPERIREATMRHGPLWARAGRAGGAPGRIAWPLPNVWLGVTTEDQERADERLPLLMDAPAAVRWVSYEPALGPVDFSPWLRSLPRIKWLVAGGESGAAFRPDDEAWYGRALADCEALGVAFYMKQMAGRRPHDGMIPASLMVREWPTTDRP